MIVTNTNASILKRCMVLFYTQNSLSMLCILLDLNKSPNDGACVMRIEGLYSLPPRFLSGPTTVVENYILKEILV